ncbi:MAG: 50S ribosomal protein L10 [Caldilineaceae bacterium]
MAITRQKKEELVAEYKEQIANASAMVFTDFRGVSVAQVQALRAKVGENNAKYMVVKNSLFELALSESDGNALAEKLGGPNGVLFLGEDIGKGVTALKDWIKSAQIVQITGGLLEGSTLNATQAEALADLPTKEQTLSMILGAISAPSGQLVRTINAPAASLVRVINAHVEKMQEAA